jgi:hypothetical protein
MEISNPFETEKFVDKITKSVIYETHKRELLVYLFSLQKIALGWEIHSKRRNMV